MLDCHYKYCRWNNDIDNLCSLDECVATESEIDHYRKKRTEDIVKMVSGQLNDQVEEIVKILGGE